MKGRWQNLNLSKDWKILGECAQEQLDFLIFVHSTFRAETIFDGDEGRKTRICSWNLHLIEANSITLTCKSCFHGRAHHATFTGRTRWHMQIFMQSLYSIIPSPPDSDYSMTYQMTRYFIYLILLHWADRASYVSRCPTPVNKHAANISSLHDQELTTPSPGANSKHNRLCGRNIAPIPISAEISRRSPSYLKWKQQEQLKNEKPGRNEKASSDHTVFSLEHAREWSGNGNRLHQMAQAMQPEQDSIVPFDVSIPQDQFVGDDISSFTQSTQLVAQLEDVLSIESFSQPARRSPLRYCIPHPETFLLLKVLIGSAKHALGFSPAFHLVRIMLVDK